MDRRNYLKLAGTAVLGASAFSGSVDAAYDRTIDVVADLGVDATGRTAIDDDLRPVLRDGVLLEFPDGRYRIDQLILYALTDFGMRATGDATLVPGDYPTDGSVWIGGGGVRNLLFEGFTLDTQGTGPTIGFSAYDGLTVRNIDKVGAHTTHKTAFGFSIWEADGTGLIEGLRARDGDVYDDTVGATAIYTKTKGALTFRDCEIEGWGDNGLYGSDSTGPVQVEGGYYGNNNISQIRLSSPGSYVKNTAVAVTEPRGGEPNMRGIRVCDGPGPVTVDNCDISMEHGQGSGGVVVANDGGSVAVRNSRIHVGDGYTTVGSDATRTSFGVLVDDPTPEVADATVTIDGTSVTGGGVAGSAILFRRGNTRVRDSCINQDGSRDGIVFGANSPNNRVENTNLCVPKAPFVWNDAAVSTAGNSYTETCPLPAGVQYDEFVHPTVGVADAPIPGDASRMVRPTMGTDAENPTAVIYGNYTDAGMAAFVDGNFASIARDFAGTGALNIELRMLPSSSDEDLLVQTGLGVWDKEPDKFWPFLAYAFEHGDSIDTTTIAGVRSILKAVGVRNFGWIPWLAYRGTYDSVVAADRQAADEWGLTDWGDYPPLLAFDDEIAAPQYGYEGGIATWLRNRL